MWYEPRIFHCLSHGLFFLPHNVPSDGRYAQYVCDNGRFGLYYMVLSLSFPSLFLPLVD